MFIIACIVSLVPSIALYLWLKKYIADNETDRKTISRRALLRGAGVVLPVILGSGASYFLLRATHLKDTAPLAYQALYAFIVLAFMEELFKYLAFRKVLKMSDYPFSWLDVTALMTVVALGFGILESVLYMFGASIPVVLVRGICVPHAGYGYIMGYFYGKAARTGKSGYRWFGFALAWLIHGLYDFSLSEEFTALNENLILVSLLLALLDMALVVMLIVFVKKAKNRSMYIEPLP